MSEFRAATASRWTTCACALVGLLMAMVTTPGLADTITVRDGGDGEISISTSWGDYAVYDEGGGTYWVGTQRQFDRARVIGIAQSQGNRLSTVNDGADASFVLTQTFRTRVGNTNLDNIDPGIMFSVPKIPRRPKIPSSHRYVGVDWIQDGKAGASATLVDAANGRVFAAYSHDLIGGFWFSEFSIPVSELTRKMLLVFTIPGRPPGVVSMQSLAWADYQITHGEMVSDQSDGVDPDADQIEQLRKLSLLDPSIVSGARKPQHARASLMKLIFSKDYVTNYHFKFGTYPWSCVDYNSNAAVAVNRGDDFWINTPTNERDTTYSITIRPERIRIPDGSPHDPVHDIGFCVVDAKSLNAMVGAKP